jgi:hypothetical protein
MTLMNGDICHLGSFVIARKLGVLGQTLAARVAEILQIHHSVADLRNQAEFVLLQVANVSHAAQGYCMPKIEMLHEWYLVNPKVLAGFLV